MDTFICVLRVRNNSFSEKFTYINYVVFTSFFFLTAFSESFNDLFRNFFFKNPNEPVVQDIL